MLVDVASADIGVPTRCGLSDQRNARHAQRLSQHLASTNPRPSLPFFADAASGRFRVHYARLGVDAVPVQDDNVNGLPDYVEEALIALDSVWRTEIDVLGFAVPPGDRDSGGSAAVDVYLRDLSKENGTGLYGVTRFEDLVSPQGPWDRFSTFMEIDNDFSPTDRNAFDSLIYTHTNGIEALRVTCAHEFHHVIQLGRYGFTGVQLMFYELTSTWMEQRVYPESYDWHLYTSALLRLPEGYAFSRGDALNGYAWGWFAWALQERSDTLLRHAWDRIASGDRPYAALVRACADVGTSFSDVFCSTMASMYHTGSRGAGNAYMRGAELLPEIRLDADERALPPSTSVGGAVRPFEVRAMRFTVPGSARQQVAAGMILTAPNEQALVDASTSVSVAYNVTATEDPQVGDDAIAGSSWGIRTTPRDELCTYVDGIRTVLPDGPYPQPLVLSTHSVLRFPVQDAAPGEEAVIDVRSASYGQASSFVVTVELDGDRIVAPLTDLQQFGTGIYLVDVTCLGRTTLYKVMIRR